MGSPYFARSPGRHFFKCVSCLGACCIDNTESKLWPETCPYCGGDLEHMGIVCGESVVNQKIDCPCDERCLCAKGPSCHCSCKGVNHGIGIQWKVVLVEGKQKLEATGAKVAKFASKYSQAGAAWQSLTQAYYLAWEAAYGDVTTRKNQGWIPREEFMVWVEGQRTTREFCGIRALRSHGRNAKLEKLIERMVAGAAAREGAKL